MKKITFLIVMLMIVVTAKSQIVVTTIPLHDLTTISYIDVRPLLTTPLLPVVTPVITRPIIDTYDYSIYNSLFSKPVIAPQPVINNTVNNKVNCNSNTNLPQFSTDLHTILFK